MRFKSRRSYQRDTVLLAGWLFADLFLALVVIFLSANTSGVRLQVPTPTPMQVPTLTATPTVPPAPTPTPPLPRLDLNKHRITLNVDTDGLLNNSQSAIDDLKQQIGSQGFLNGRNVGLVIVYSGAPDDALTNRAYDASNKVMDVLRSINSEGFPTSAYYDPLYILNDPVNTVIIDIYLFAQ